MHIWEQFLNHSEQFFGKENIDKWLRTLKISHFDACNLHLTASSAFQVAWFEEHFRHFAQKNFLNNNNTLIRIHLKFVNPTLKDATANNATLPSSISKPDPTPPVEEEKQCEKNIHDPFAEYISSPENQFALGILKEICEKIAQDPSSPPLFNPIYLFGSAGSGKTHLLLSMHRYFESNGLNSLYIRAEKFAEEVVYAIRSGDSLAFRKKYRHLDVFLIDDVYLIGGKTATQEELFHTFNALHIDGKLIILAANCTPSNLKEIEPRLVSRFEWGTTLELHPLNQEELTALIKQKASENSIVLDSGAMDSLVSQCTTPNHAVQAIDALLLRNHHANKKSNTLSASCIQESIPDILEGYATEPINFETILDNTAKYFKITSQEILGKSHAKPYVIARRIGMFLCRSVLNLSFVKIGKLFDRDHSTVMSSVKAIQKEIEKGSPEIISAIKAIQSST